MCSPNSLHCLSISSTLHYFSASIHDGMWKRAKPITPSNTCASGHLSIARARMHTCSKQTRSQMYLRSACITTFLSKLPMYRQNASKSLTDVHCAEIPWCSSVSSTNVHATITSMPCCSAGWQTGLRTCDRHQPLHSCTVENCRCGDGIPTIPERLPQLFRFRCQRTRSTNRAHPAN